MHLPRSNTSYTTLISRTSTPYSRQLTPSHNMFIKHYLHRHIKMPLSIQANRPQGTARPLHDSLSGQLTPASAHLPARTRHRQGSPHRPEQCPPPQGPAPGTCHWAELFLVGNGQNVIYCQAISIEIRLYSLNINLCRFKG